MWCSWWLAGLVEHLFVKFGAYTIFILCLFVGRGASQVFVCVIVVVVVCVSSLRNVSGVHEPIWVQGGTLLVLLGSPKAAPRASRPPKARPRVPQGVPMGPLLAPKVHQISHFGAQESPKCLILCVFAFLGHDFVANLVLSLFLDIF